MVDQGTSEYINKCKYRFSLKYIGKNPQNNRFHIREGIAVLPNQASKEMNKQFLLSILSYVLYHFFLKRE